jgi:hypothetical protein
VTVTERCRRAGNRDAVHGPEQVYIVVNEQLEEITQPKLWSTEIQAEALLHLRAFLDDLGILSWSIVHETS